MKKINPILPFILITIFLILGLAIYFSPIYIWEGYNGLASEFCQEKGWSDWYGVYFKFGKEFIICDIR